jgi:hypothetical protein
MSSLLGRAELLAALQAMDDQLSLRGVRAELFVVGGAAMAIAYDARRSTADVDAVFAPTDVVREVAKKVGADLGLEPDWLNDGVKAFIPSEDPDRISVFEGSALSVAAASPHFLLAMKLLASRIGRDQDDIRFLYELCGFSTLQEGLDLLERCYPQHLILPRVQFLLQEMLEGDQRDDHRGDAG